MGNQGQTPESVDDPRDLDTPPDDRVDIQPEARRTPAPKDDNPDTDDAAPVKREGPFEDRRKAVAEKFKRLRATGQDDLDVHGGEERERALFGDNIETRSDRLRRAAEEEIGGGAEPEGAAGDDAAPAGETPAQRRRRLRVNGRDVELDENEIIAHAQRSLAAGEVLADAKRIRDTYYQKLEELAGARGNQPSAEQLSESQRHASSEDTKPDDRELDEIIDKIQVGDQREARNALDKYGEHIERRILQRIGNLDERIERQTSAQAERQAVESRTRQTLDQFVSEHSEFANNRVLQSALQTEVIGAMKDEMAQMGIGDAELQRFAGTNQIADQNVAVGAAYRYLQSKGASLPDHGTVLANAAGRVREAFRSAYTGNLTDPKVDTVRMDALDSRRERKRLMAPQPRRAGASAVEQPDRSRDEMRRQAARDAQMARRGR